jgi:hypothetical protein
MSVWNQSLNKTFILSWKTFNVLWRVIFHFLQVDKVRHAHAKLRAYPRLASPFSPLL